MSLNDENTGVDSGRVNIKATIISNLYYRKSKETSAINWSLGRDLLGAPGRAVPTFLRPIVRWHRHNTPDALERVNEPIARKPSAQGQCSAATNC